MQFSRLTLFFCLLLCLCYACENDAPATTEVAPAAATTTQNPPVANGTVQQVPAGGYAPEGFRVVWSDEFNYTGRPDTAKWGYQTGGFGWIAKELQYYTEGDNAMVKDGMLQLVARKETKGANEYTSTRMVTKKKALFRQGYFEARMRFPAGEGLRSAWWMVGDTVSKIGWPNAGEIDLVEHYGKVPNYVGAAVQTTDNVWNVKGQKGGSVELPTATTEFHVYSCLWKNDDMTFYVDGKEFWTYQRNPLRPQSSWPFDWPFYMAFNLSVGGERNQQSNNIDESKLPAGFLVDYVRVYQPTQ